jgi:hypothetical protein
MSETVDLNALAADILDVLRKHKLHVEIYGLSVTVRPAVFQELARQLPELTTLDRAIFKTGDTAGHQWHIQIAKRYELEDVPPGFLTPP